MTEEQQIARQEAEHTIPEEEKLGYLKILRRYPPAINCLVEFTAQVVFTYCSPTMSTFLEDHYDLNPDNVGYVLSLAPLCYIITCIPVSRIKTGKKQWIMISLAGLGISFIYLGPDEPLAGTDKNFILTLITWALVGVMSSFLWILCLPLINELLLQEFPNQPERCANLSSGLLNASISLGDLIGPIIGGVFTDLWGFQRGCTIMGMYTLANALLFVPLLVRSQRPPAKVLEQATTDEATTSDIGQLVK